MLLAVVALALMNGVVLAFHHMVGNQVPKGYVAFYKLTLPYIRLLNGISGWFLRRLGVHHALPRPEEEIRSLLRKMQHSASQDGKADFKLFDNLFSFSETTAREIMIPRTEMVCLYAGNSFEENRRMAIEERLTRYPVCDPDKDHIVGFVHIKDLMKASDSSPADIRSLVRPLLHVPESIPIRDLLRLMQKQKTQMVLLIDDYGGTSGLVTLEDILEEIVGEIQDEFDQERPPIERVGETDYSIDGLYLIEDLNTAFGLNLASEEYDTIGGWLYSMVEMPPRRGQSVCHDGYVFIVEEVDNLRISRIRIRRQDGDKDNSETVA